MDTLQGIVNSLTLDQCKVLIREYKEFQEVGTLEDVSYLRQICEKFSSLPVGISSAAVIAEIAVKLYGED